MLFVKAPLKLAEPIRKKLVAEGIFDPSHEVDRDVMLRVGAASVPCR